MGCIEQFSSTPFDTLPAFGGAGWVTPAIIIFQQNQLPLLHHFPVKHPHTVMITGTAGEYFVGDKFILIGAEFVIHDIQEVLPPHGGGQTVLFLLELSFKDQFYFSGPAIGLHFETDLLFFFTIDMIDLDAEFVTLLFDPENTSGHALRRVLYFTFFFIHHPGTGEVGSLCDRGGLNGKDKQNCPKHQGDFWHGSGLLLKFVLPTMSGTQGTVK